MDFLFTWWVVFLRVVGIFESVFVIVSFACVLILEE